MSQFFTQDDKAKLSSAGYATCDGGFDVNVQGAKSGQDVQTRDLSPETMALLDEAREGDEMPAVRRSTVRRRLAVAVGVAAPLTLGTTAAASVGVAGWVVRGHTVSRTGSG